MEARPVFGVLLGTGAEANHAGTGKDPSLASHVLRLTIIVGDAVGAVDALVADTEASLTIADLYVLSRCEAAADPQIGVFAAADNAVGAVGVDFEFLLAVLEDEGNFDIDRLQGRFGADLGFLAGLLLRYLVDFVLAVLGFGLDMVHGMRVGEQGRQQGVDALPRSQVLVGVG